MLRENKEQAKALKWMRDRGIYAVKYPGGVYGEKGTPDILICLAGAFHAIEMKSETGNQTPLQKQHQTRILKSGGTYNVCRSAAEVVLLCEGWINELSR